MGPLRKRRGASPPLPVVRFEVSSLGPRPVAAARSPLEAELSELKESLEELATENQAQEKAIDGLRDQLDQVSAEKASAEGKAAQLTADLGTARDEGARERQAAELARTELAKAQLRLEACRGWKPTLARCGASWSRKVRHASTQSKARPC